MSFFFPSWYKELWSLSSKTYPHSEIRLYSHWRINLHPQVRPHLPFPAPHPSLSRSGHLQANCTHLEGYSLLFLHLSIPSPPHPAPTARSSRGGKGGQEGRKLWLECPEPKEQPSGRCLHIVFPPASCWGFCRDPPLRTPWGFLGQGSLLTQPATAVAVLALRGAAPVAPCGSHRLSTWPSWRRCKVPQEGLHLAPQRSAQPSTVGEVCLVSMPYAFTLTPQNDSHSPYYIDSQVEDSSPLVPIKLRGYLSN